MTNIINTQTRKIQIIQSDEPIIKSWNSPENGLEVPLEARCDAPSFHDELYEVLKKKDMDRIYPMICRIKEIEAERRMNRPIFTIEVSSHPVFGDENKKHWVLAHDEDWIHPEWDGEKIFEHRHDPKIELKPALKQWCEEKDKQGQVKNIVIHIFKQSTARHKEYMHWMARSLTSQCEADIEIKEI